MRRRLTQLLSQIEPTWKVHSNFITEHLARALSLDALRSSHPIEMPCPNEETIQQIFDALTYSKGEQRTPWTSIPSEAWTGMLIDVNAASHRR